MTDRLTITQWRRLKRTTRHQRYQARLRQPVGERRAIAAWLRAVARDDARDDRDPDQPGVSVGAERLPARPHPPRHSGGQP